jgi:uncharacterized protein (TIGR02145 family)
MTKQDLIGQIVNIGFLCILMTSCKKDDKITTQPIEYGIVTDVDNNSYTTVKIGSQWWMALNLKVTHFRDKSPIENVLDSAAWSMLTTGAYCWYNNDVNSGYGGLYNWYSVNDNRKICPSGWHVPSINEWINLINYLGGEMEAGRKMGSGVIGFPPNLGGYRCGYGDYTPIFYYGGIRGFWWSSTEDINTASALNADYVCIL